MKSRTKKKESTPEKESKKSLFDHVKHIRQVKDPNYYKNLSDEDKKSFNHFMILRALSMDENIVEEMATLYTIFDKIPSEQFYTLLISVVPKSYGYYPWIKTKKFKNNKELVKLVKQRFTVPTYQANEYLNILLRSPQGQEEVVNICRAFGLEDKEIQDLIDGDNV